MARRSPIRWTANQEARLRKAVSSYNAAVTRMEKSGKYTAVPNRTTVAREKSLIETADELRQREKELGRILLKNNPKANDVVDMSSDGTFLVPQYLDNEIKLAARSINGRRKQQRLALFTDAAEMSKQTEYMRYANKNLRDIDEDNYLDGDDLDDLWEEKYPKTYAYAERYKEAWSEYNGDPSVTDIIDWFAENEPDELALIFESGDDEVDINYIYVVSSDKTPAVVRHNNIMRYWNDHYRRFTGNDHESYMGEE